MSHLVNLSTTAPQATDVGDSMIVHVFAAYFGLAVSRVLYKRDIEEAENKEGSVYQSDLFSMIGKQHIILVKKTNIIDCRND